MEDSEATETPQDQVSLDLGESEVTNHPLNLGRLAMHLLYTGIMINTFAQGVIAGSEITKLFDTDTLYIGIDVSVWSATFFLAQWRYFEIEKHRAQQYIAYLKNSNPRLFDEEELWPRLKEIVKWPFTSLKNFIDFLVHALYACSFAFLVFDSNNEAMTGVKHEYDTVLAQHTSWPISIVAGALAGIFTSLFSYSMRAPLFSIKGLVKQDSAYFQLSERKYEGIFRGLFILFLNLPLLSLSTLLGILSHNATNSALLTHVGDKFSNKGRKSISIILAVVYGYFSFLKLMPLIKERLYGFCLNGEPVETKKKISRLTWLRAFFMQALTVVAPILVLTNALSELEGNGANYWFLPLTIFAAWPLIFFELSSVLRFPHYPITAPPQRRNHSEKMHIRIVRTIPALVAETVKLTLLMRLAEVFFGNAGEDSRILFYMPTFFIAASYFRFMKTFKEAMLLKVFSLMVFTVLGEIYSTDDSIWARMRVFLPSAFVGLTYLRIGHDVRGEQPGLKISVFEALNTYAMILAGYGIYRLLKVVDTELMDKPILSDLTSAELISDFCAAHFFFIAKYFIFHDNRLKQSLTDIFAKISCACISCACITKCFKDSNQQTWPAYFAMNFETFVDAVSDGATTAATSIVELKDATIDATIDAVIAAGSVIRETINAVIAAAIAIGSFICEIKNALIAAAIATSSCICETKDAAINAASGCRARIGFFKDNSHTKDGSSKGLLTDSKGQKAGYQSFSNTSTKNS